MKKYFSLIILMITTILSGCEENSINGDKTSDYMSNLKDHIVIKQDNAKLTFDSQSNTVTRYAHTKEYKIVATDPKVNTQFISYLTITKSDNHYLFEHYTEDLDLIATIKCNLQLLIEDVYIEQSVSETRGLRGWWICTRIEYDKIKAEQAEKNNMLLDICSDYLPMATINSAISALYCMGIA